MKNKNVDNLWITFRFYIILVVLSNIVILFSSCSRGPARAKYWLKHGFRMESSINEGLNSINLQEYLNEVTEITLKYNNYVEILKDGPEVLDKMYRLISDAKEYILLEEYIFRYDEVGKDFIKLLQRKSKEGIKVYVIIDAIGSYKDSSKIYCKLKESGVNVSIHNPVINWTVVRINKRNHRKVLVVDGLKGVISGIGLGKEYRYWRDLGVFVKGESIADLEYSFWKAWKDSGWGFVHKSIPIPLLTRVKHAIDNVLEPLELKNIKELCKETEYGSKGVRIVPSYPFVSHYENFDNLINIINNTKDYLYITNAYFVPNILIRNALKDAVKRGVDVKIILPNKTDLPVVRRTSRMLYATLLKGGIKIYELKGVILHAKYIVADDYYFSVGSTNILDRSFYTNFECNVDVFDKNIALEMKKIFYEDLAASIEIEYDVWQERSIFQKINEWMHVTTFWAF